MALASKTVGQVEGFVTMLLAACDDAGMNDTLEKLLSIPDPQRRELVQYLVHQFRQSGAPQSLVEAFVCLRDDEVADKAYEIIYKCKHNPTQC